MIVLIFIKISIENYRREKGLFCGGMQEIYYNNGLQLL